MKTKEQRRIENEKNFNGEIIETYDYKKHDGAKNYNSYKTGYALLLNTTNYVVLDFDFNKKLEKSVKENIYETLYENVKDYNVKIVKTASGGLHLYCLWDESFNADKNRYRHCYECDEYEVDLYIPTPKDKRSLIMLPNSIIINYSEIKSAYKLLKNVEDKNLLKFNDLASVLYEDLGIIFKTSSKDEKSKENDVDKYIENKTSNDKTKKFISPKNVEKINIKMLDIITNGFNGLEIHYFATKIEGRLSLLPIFSAYFSLESDEITKDDILNALNHIRNNAKLTQKAKDKWKKTLKNDITTSCVNVLYKILEIHNPIYYIENIYPLISEKFNKLNLNEEFSLTDIAKKDYNNIIKFYDYQTTKDDYIEIPDLTHKCFDFKAFIEDALKVLVIIDKAREIFILKEYNYQYNSYDIAYLTNKEAKTKLKSINVGYDWELVEKKDKLFKRKNYSFWDILEMGKIKNHFKKLDSCFHSFDKNIFSYFQGYNFEKQNSYDKNAIDLWLNDHVLNDICDGNVELFDYLNNWIALLLQKHIKSEVCLIIIGNPGSGKNKFFSDVICKLLGKYANENISDIDHIVGNFNKSIENKKLLILNEISSVSNANGKVLGECEMNKFKSLITDKYVPIRAMYEPVRISETVCNFIMITNNDDPVHFNNDDRRFCVIKNNNRNCKNIKYFEKLNDTMNEYFYKNLFSFYMLRNIDNFNVRKFPETDARKDIIETTKSSVELFIQSEIKTFNDENGYNCANCYSDYKSYCDRNNYKPYNNKNFGIMMKKYTERKQKRINGVKNNRYFLLENCKDKFDLNGDDNEDYSEDLNEILNDA